VKVWMGLLVLWTLYFGLCSEGNGSILFRQCLVRCAVLAGLPNGVLSSGDRVRQQLISNIWVVPLPCCSRCPCPLTHPPVHHKVHHPSDSSTVAQASQTGTATMGTEQGQGAEPQTIDGTRLSSP
jgi:hypothetical protein